MKISLGRKLLHSALCVMLAGCMTPRTTSPVADYCSVLAERLRQCASGFEGSSADHATKGECLRTDGVLDQKYQEALNSLPDKSASRLNFMAMDLLARALLLSGLFNGQNKSEIIKNKNDAENLIKQCNDFAMSRN